MAQKYINFNCKNHLPTQLIIIKGFKELPHLPVKSKKKTQQKSELLNANYYHILQAMNLIDFL